LWQISPYTYKLDLSAPVQIHKLHPISLLDPVFDDPLPGQHVPSLPVEVDGKEKHQVESISAFTDVPPAVTVSHPMVWLQSTYVGAL
jgi:hypothetical protein